MTACDPQWHPNRLPENYTLADFTGFRLSPVHEHPDYGMIVCLPHEADFWSVYGFHGEAQEWQIVHDATAQDIGEALVRIEKATGNRIEYSDPTRAFSNTTLLRLSLLFGKWIEELDADDPRWIPVHEIRNAIDLALQAQED